MTGRGRDEESIVMIPFMAQGHIAPFLSLAFQIHQITGHQIIFINTPLIISKLRSTLPSNTPIRLIELPFCGTDHGLPPDSESTDVLPYPLIVRLLEASQSLKPAFDKLISDITQQQNGRPPLCIIADMFFGWTVEIANKLGIFHSIFLTCSAYGSAIYFSLWIHLPHLKTYPGEFLLPDFPEVSVLHRSQLPNNLRNADGTDSWSLIVPKLFKFWFSSDGFLVNTIQDLEQTGLNYFRRKFENKPVWAVASQTFHSQNFFGFNSKHCQDWLDTHPPSSVLFVSFGSQNTISASQLKELAIGLETSGNSFIWVVRPPVGFDINGEFLSEWLPDGFEDRVTQGNKGLIVRKWAPQIEILSHKSTGAFLSHCGWNSVMESLSHGVPIIGWPLAAEQFYNSKLLEEEVGVCVEVARGNASEVQHQHIKRVIELVMGGNQKSKEMKNKACLVKEMINNAVGTYGGFQGSSGKAIADFVTTVKQHCSSCQRLGS